MTNLTKTIVIVVGIAIAGGVLVPTVNTVRDGPCRRGPEKNFAVASTTAIKAYHEQYGYFPNVGAPADPSRDVIVGESEAGAVAPNEALFDILMAVNRGTNTGDAENPEKIAFFDPVMLERFWKDSAPGRGIDQSGIQFNVIMDTNGDGQLDVGGVYTDFADRARPRTSVGVFSFGKDRQPGTKGNRIHHGSDDLVSWQ